MSLNPVHASNTIRALRRNSQRWTYGIRAKHTREGREPYPYYWSTHFRSHDCVPHPTLVPSEHPTAAIHNLFARWQCVLHSYGQKLPKDKSKRVEAEGTAIQEPEKSFLEIAKQRKIALKLYRLLSMVEARRYTKALECSPTRVYIRPKSALQTAGVSKQLLDILNSKEYERRWQMLPIGLADAGLKAISNSEAEHDTPSTASTGFKLMKQYRFDKMQAASHFVRLACQTIVTHDHHPEIVMHFVPEDRMFEVKVSTWTHAPQQLSDIGTERNRDVNTLEEDIETSDSDFDRVTQSTAGSLTVLSPSRPQFPKTIPVAPGLTRKDFLLAWDLDELEIQTRARSLSVARKGKSRLADAVSTQEATKSPRAVSLPPKTSI